MFFKRLITDRQIMRERLPVGLFALIGKQGAGKTSGAVAMLCNDWKYHHLERFNECKQFTDELNKNGFDLHLCKNKTIYYSSDRIILSKKPYVETWYIDPEKFKLPNLKEDVQYVPRGSVVFLPEFDNIINCRDWKSMSPYLVALAKYARHWDLTIIIDFQVWLQLDASWRRLMMYTLFVYETYDIKRWLLFKRIFHIKNKRYWRWLWCDNQLNAFVKDLGTMTCSEKIIKKLKKRVCMIKKYVFKDCIFDRYESQSGYRYFVRGIKDYVFIPHNKIDNSPAGIEEYCKSHPVVSERKN